MLISGRPPLGRRAVGRGAGLDLDRVFTAAGSRPVRWSNGAWDTFYPTFARAVRGEGPPPVDGDDAVATADVLDAARVSASAGRPCARRRPVTGRELLDELEAQEARLVFDHFDDDVRLGPRSRPREARRSAGLPVAISIRRNGQRLFHAALPGSSADNDAWLARKSAVVDRYGQSSLYVGEQFRVHGGTFDHDSRLDAATFAAHGGAFPIIVRGTGCVGTVAVSGLPEVEDHRFLVATLEAFLAEDR